VGRSFVQKGKGCCSKLLDLGVARQGFFLGEGILDYKEGRSFVQKGKGCCSKLLVLGGPPPSSTSEVH